MRSRLDLGGLGVGGLAGLGMDAPEPRGGAPVDVEGGVGPLPAGRELVRGGGELRHGELVEQLRVFQPDADLVLVGEEVAQHRSTRGFVGVDADEAGRRRARRHALLGQHALDLPRGGAVALGGDALPDGPLAVVVGGDGEGHQGLEVELLGAVGVQQLGRRVAEAKPLLDGALGDAESRGDGRDGDAGPGDPGERDHLVGGVHRDAYHVLRERELAGVAVGGDLAGHRVIGMQRAVLGERAQSREAAPAGDDGEALDAVRVRRVGPHDEVLQQVVLSDGRPELGLGRVVGRGLAHVLGCEREPAERDVPDRRFVHGCILVHADLPWMRGGARSAALSGPARARPSPGPAPLAGALGRGSGAGGGVAEAIPAGAIGACGNRGAGDWREGGVRAERHVS